MQFENVGGGSLYTLSEFFARIFDDMEWEDMPLPVTNEQLMDHFDRSVLRPFSLYHPRQEVVRIGEENRIDTNLYNGSFRRYRLPMYLFPTSRCLGVASIEPLNNLGYSDSLGMVPFLAEPDALLGAMADIRLVSSLGAASSHTPRPKFKKPDILDIYGGYTNCAYELILLLTHDNTLSTVPDTAFESLYQFALLDTKAYFYSKLKRKDNLNTGVGDIQMKIDDWAGAQRERDELAARWREEGYNFDYEGVDYFN